MRKTHNMCIYIYENVIMKTTVNNEYTLIIKAFKKRHSSALLEDGYYQPTNQLIPWSEAFRPQNCGNYVCS